MKCLRCGYCCKHCWVDIIDDPSLGYEESNLIEHPGLGRSCKHLLGDKPGEYACAVHEYPWYKETPCYRHGLKNGEGPCRLGTKIMKRYEAGRYKEKVLINEGASYDEWLESLMTNTSTP